MNKYFPLNARLLNSTSPQALSFSSTREVFYKRDGKEARDRTDTETQTRIHQGPLTLYQEIYRAANLAVPVLGLDVVGEGLGLDVRGVVVTVVVVVYIDRLVIDAGWKRGVDVREWGSSSGPTYSSLTTLPHSPQRSRGRSRDT